MSINVASAQSDPPTLTSANATPAVFVAEFKQSVISAFNADGRTLFKIKTPGGTIATDKERHLYVATYFNSSYVTVLSPPEYSSPVRIMLSNHFQAVGVMVDARTSEFAVIARQSEFYGGQSLVSFFRPGQTSPCNTLFNNSGINDFDGNGAYDESGTLFIAINNQSGDTLASIAGGCSAKDVTQLTFDQPIIPTAGFGFSSNNNLVIQPGYSQNQVYTYSHPKSGIFGPPITVTTLQPPSGKQVALVGLSSDGHHLWATGSKEIGLYAYPEGGRPTRFLQGIHEPDRLAVLPPLEP